MHAQHHVLNRQLMPCPVSPTEGCARDCQHGPNMILALGLA